MFRCIVTVLGLALLAPVTATAGSLDLGVADTGISFGDSPRWNGIRVNLVDEDVDDVRGLNLTLWRPSTRVGGRIAGLGVGVYGPRADELAGVHAGLWTVHANREFHGIGFGLAGVSSGPDGSNRRGSGAMRGLMIGGVGLASGGDLTGVAVGGLGANVDSDLTGIAVGGLGMNVGRGVDGIAVGGLGMNLGDTARGVVVAGLGANVGDDLTGAAVAGLGFNVGGTARGLVVTGLGSNVGESLTGGSVAVLGNAVGLDLNGVNVAGVGTGVGRDASGLVVTGVGYSVRRDFTGISAALVGGATGGRLTGLHVAGVGIHARETRAITVTVGGTRGEIMRGATVGAYNRFDESMTGLAIGLVNITDELHGVQLGLLNIVRDRDGWNRMLPILNVGR